MNLIQDLKRVSHAINFGYVTGISIALLHMIFPSYLYLKLITLTIYTTLFVSRKHLDSSVPYDDPKFYLSDYKLVRADNLSKNKRDGVGIYFKEILAVRPVPTISSLKECLQQEVFTGNKKRLVLSQDKFYDFLFSLD